MADIFDEVTEELRQDQLKTFLKKYQKLIFLSIFLVITFVCCFKGYEYIKEKKSLENANLFFNALELIKEKKYNQAEKNLLKLKEESDKGYYILSLFVLADLSIKKDDFYSMENYYQKIKNNAEIDPFYKSLATIYLSVNSKNLKFDEKIKMLDPILTSPNELQSIASELEVILLLNSDQKESGVKKLKLLMNRSDININQKNRLSVIQEIYNN